MKFAKGILLSVWLFLVPTSVLSATLTDYLGTGTNPRISLTLSANGPGWNTFVIDYQGTGNVPWSASPSSNWSSWDAKDTQGNYYGTITLKSNGNSVLWDNYSVAGSNYLEGIRFSFNRTGTPGYQLTADKIYSPFTPTGVKLADYLGTGSNPRLKLTLSANGAGYSPYTIDYQGIGNVPFSSNASQRWSAWDVKDELGNYYGTITLDSDGRDAKWGGYAAGTNGYYLKDITYGYDQGANAFKLGVGTIFRAGVTNANPFPTTPIATPAVYPGTSERVVLSVSGKDIVNSRGVKIRLRGLVRPSLEFNKQGEYLSPTDINNIATWNGNVLRVNLNQRYWLDSAPKSQRGSYRQIVDAVIYHAMQHKMAVILDLHFTRENATNITTYMPDADSVTFWTQVAYEYKDFGTVLFEVFNEPQGVTPAVWRNGGQVTIDGTQYNFVGHQQLINAIRATGANNICIVNGLDYGYNLSFISPSNWLTGSHIVYGIHPYNEKGQPGYSQGGTYDNTLAGVLPYFPVIFTEFGVDQPQYFPNGYAAVYGRILDYANANSISYTGFAWWVDLVKPDTFPDLIKDWSGTPYNGGVLVYDDMQRIRPLPVDSSQ